MKISALVWGEALAPRYQTPFGNAMRREIAFPMAGVSAGRSGMRALPQTLPPRETEFRWQGRSQTEFGNEKNEKKGWQR